MFQELDSKIKLHSNNLEKLQELAQPLYSELREIKMKIQNEEEILKSLVVEKQNLCNHRNDKDIPVLSVDYGPWGEIDGCCTICDKIFSDHENYYDLMDMIREMEKEE